MSQEVFKCQISCNYIAPAQLLTETLENCKSQSGGCHFTKFASSNYQAITWYPRYSYMRKYENILRTKNIYSLINWHKILGSINRISQLASIITVNKSLKLWFPLNCPQWAVSVPAWCLQLSHWMMPRRVSILRVWWQCSPFLTGESWLRRGWGWHRDWQRQGEVTVELRVHCLVHWPRQHCGHVGVVILVRRHGEVVTQFRNVLYLIFTHDCIFLLTCQFLF